ncbi:hypothetical protein ACSW96_08055 [Clostridium perfringens]
MEHNKYNPSLDTTIALSNALGVTLNELDNIINTITNSDLDAKQLELLELYLTALIRD